MSETFSQETIKEISNIVKVLERRRNLARLAWKYARKTGEEIKKERHDACYEMLGTVIQGLKNGYGV
jgi:hypothetical protein